MLELLFSRGFVIGLAVIGGLLSLISSWAQKRGRISEATAIWLNKAAYGFMGVSMVLFIAAGLFGYGK